MFAEYLRSKYADDTADAVVAVSSGADVPPRASAVIVPFEPAKTIELARRLQPRLENVFVVEDDSERSSGRREALQRDLSGLGEGLRVEYLQGLSVAALLERVGRLPANSMILYAEAGLRAAAPVRAIAVS